MRARDIKEPITISKSTKSSSDESTRTAPLDVPSIQAVGTITIEGRATKRSRTSEPAGPSLSLPVDKGEKAIEHLSSAWTMSY